MSENFLLDVPSCISKFHVFQSEHVESESIGFFLQCAHCKSQEFIILCYPIVAEDDETFEGVSAGQIVERSPHHLQCSGCNRRELLFDPEIHGYDGALGHGSSYECGNVNERPITSVSSVYKTKVEFFYSIEFDELAEIAKDSNTRPQDLFDGIAIHAVNSDGVIIKTLGYECA
ncbi:MAG: hypothetical protein O9333_00885 [Beijerinckiaceae bacterium]|jgi:hypothetical protein|nr:hypothetical protein [Beijerinckiaceae bacterium]